MIQQWRAPHGHLQRRVVAPPDRIHPLRDGDRRRRVYPQTLRQQRFRVRVHPVARRAVHHHARRRDAVVFRLHLGQRLIDRDDCVHLIAHNAVVEQAPTILDAGQLEGIGREALSEAPKADLVRVVDQLRAGHAPGGHRCGQDAIAIVRMVDGGLQPGGIVGHPPEGAHEQIVDLAPGGARRLNRHAHDLEAVAPLAFQWAVGIHAHHRDFIARTRHRPRLLQDAIVGANVVTNQHTDTRVGQNAELQIMPRASRPRGD